jgi:hypothetical protein
MQQQNYIHTQTQHQRKISDDVQIFSSHQQLQQHNIKHAKYIIYKAQANKIISYG